MMRMKKTMPELEEAVAVEIAMARLNQVCDGVDLRSYHRHQHRRPLLHHHHSETMVEWQRGKE